jgi:NCAIR mutase (PurE)-related protein
MRYAGGLEVIADVDAGMAGIHRTVWHEFAARRDEMFLKVFVR